MAELKNLTNISAFQKYQKQWELMHYDFKVRKNLSENVQEGWERSICHRIDYENALPIALNPDEFFKVKQETKRIRAFANSIVSPLFNLYQDNNIGILLFSEHGILLKLTGNDVFSSWIKQNRISIGTNWTEEIIGANIFSIGISKNTPTCINGMENYSRFLINVTAYFTPIKLETGKLYGGIALVSLDDSDQSNLPTLCCSIARAIELQLFWFNQMDQYIDIAEGTGMIYLDQSQNRNKILILSKGVIRILGISMKDYHYIDLEKVIDPLPANKSFWEIINGETRVQDRTIQLSVGGQVTSVSISTTSFKEEQFHIKGTSVFINSFERINKLISKYSGNIARYNFDNIIGDSKPMLELIRRCKSASLTDSSILILGESGVGKEIVAQAIHNNSKRSKGPFVAINCAALSKELIASELFGYERGAFTGAKKEGAVGKLELADTGTLFLDEVGDMPLDLQALLLRVLEEKSFRKVGGNSLIKTNVRIIAATNKNLSESIRQGHFRQDLFYRLGIIRLHIPPLRERENDILLLAEHSISKICSRLGKPYFRLSKRAKHLFQNYSWPGNVRELLNLLEGIISIKEEAIINENDICSYLGELLHTVPLIKIGTGNMNEIANGQYKEKEMILEALKVCKNNKSKAAEHLHISRSTFYRRLEEYGIK